MTRRLNWLLALLVLTMLVAACGPDMVTPTPGAEPEEADTQPTAPAEESPEPVVLTAGELPVDEDDWRALGSADAPVTMIEYSDFQ
jgi:predicted small lipoprotein YifL